MDFTFLERNDGQGEWQWDPFLWVLASGAILVLVGLVLALSHVTVPPNGKADGTGYIQPEHPSFKGH